MRVMESTPKTPTPTPTFPFLFGGTFIEGKRAFWYLMGEVPDFPSFSEGLSLRPRRSDCSNPPGRHFPSYLEGLSLRQSAETDAQPGEGKISLPLWKGFH